MHERALAGARDAGDHDEHPERDIDVHVLQVVGVRAADLQRAGRRPDRVLERCSLVEMTAGQAVGRLQPLDGPLEADGPAAGARPGTEVDDVIGDLDRLRLVLDDEHRVALVAQLEQEVVHPLDVVRVQADRGLVEDVGDVRQRGPDVPDHLRALSLSPGQRAGRAVQREVAQADLDERVEEMQQVADKRRDARYPRWHAATRPRR